jgi:hypothetical protein
MSNAPERIWAEPYMWNKNAGRWVSQPRYPELPTQYIRADLAPKWVSVDERLPELGRTVFVHGGVGYYDYNKEEWVTLTGEAWPGRRIEWNVTHWMPLPTPPEGEE